MTKPTPHQCMEVTIEQWEGLYQALPGDPGNWVNGVCIGTMRGVTPPVLALHRGIPVSQVTPEMMRTVTRKEAADIGDRLFYRTNGLDKLTWSPPADIIVDFGWGSGPGQAAKSCERMLGLNAPDHTIDKLSAVVWDNALRSLGTVGLVKKCVAMRKAFYDLICNNNANLMQFKAGWYNRADWQDVGGDWWRHWCGEISTEDFLELIERQRSRGYVDPRATRLLSKGSLGPEVRELQRQLAACGYLMAAQADGAFGPITEAAVLKLQRKHNLKVDGWVGDATRAALAREIAEG